MSKIFHIRPGDPDYTDSKRPDVIHNPALYSPGEPFQVVIEPGITEIDNDAFEEYAGMTSVVIPDTVKRIGAFAFSECTGLTSLVIPTGVEVIELEAFRGCTGVTSVVINGTKEIGINAFADCKNLTSVVLNDVKELKAGAFSDCIRLKSVSFSGRVPKIGGGVFSGCRSLRQDILFGGTLYHFGKQSGKVVIPDGVRTIGPGALQDFRRMTSVVIHGSVKSIEFMTFHGCKKLTSVEIRDGVKLGRKVFNGCPCEKAVRAMRRRHRPRS